jgi:predicted alpha-1,2-mannosidase
MAKAVADVTGENQAGYGSDFSKIRGFSHMHDSGTGGVTSLGNFPIFPHAGCPGDDIKRCNFTEHERVLHHTNGSVEARPGYFALSLESGIKAEMTVANHTALYRFTFPETPKGVEDSKLSPVILAELTDLSHTQSDVHLWLNTTSGRLTGKARFIPSFGTGNYRLHFCADFKGAAIREVGGWNSTGAVGYYENGEFNSSFRPRGGFTQFHAPDNKERQIIARVGVSFMSVEQACKSSETEIPDFDFDKTLKTAEEAWREKLDVISIKDGGVSDDLKTVFWSGIYRNFISPQDYTGENYLWTSDEPYYDSYYCIWDSFRAQHPLLTMLDPQSQTLMVRSLIDIWRHEGHMPDCRMSLCKGWSQGGSNADVVLADAYLKGLNDGVNWTDGYAAVIQDAEVEPGRWDLAGRGGMASWKGKGYIPIDDRDSLGFGPHTRSVSRTVEYAYNDFCVAQMAAGLSSTTDYEKYMNRSSNWKNLLRDDQVSTINGKDTGFLGVLQPKYFNQSWAYQDPLLCSPLLQPDSCYLTMDGHETYEGSCWLYTLFIPGDIAGLVSALGTPEQFVERLDFVHDSGMLYVGDEQSFLTPFLYHYVGRPGLSAKRAHYYVPSQFNNTLVGIPGNDDSGAMGAFASFIMMGVFPNAGQNVYFIIPPYFKEISIRNPSTGKTATIRTVNFDSQYRNIFIQKATLNGQPYSKNWIDHGFFLDGGVLELVLGPEEGKWGTRPEDCPPSLSAGGPANGTWVCNRKGQ